MKISDSELFLGLCFLISAFSKDKPPEGCIVVKEKKVISSGFSSIDILGEHNGTAEKFALSSLESLSGFDVYLDHTPSPLTLNYLSKFNFRKLVYFESKVLCTEEAQPLFSKVFRFDGNLNWIRDRVSKMKSFDIFI